MKWISLGSFFAFISVLGGAFGAHFLKNQLNEYSFLIFNTAMQYAMYHALALVLLGLLSLKFSRANLLKACGFFFSAGIVIFSGSLCALSLTGQKWLGAITPIGGLSFLIGWIILGVFSFRDKEQNEQ